MQAERQQLLERQRALAVRAARRASGRRGARAPGAGSGRRAPRRSRARATGCASRASSPASRARSRSAAGSVGLVGPQDLGHEHREPVLVPDEQRLVAAPAADPAQDRAAGRELVALVQPPRGSRPPGGLPGRPARRPSCHSSSSAASANFELSAPTGWSDGFTARNPSGAPSASTTAAAAAAANTRGRVRWSTASVVVGEGEEGVGQGRGHRRWGGGVGPRIPQFRRSTIRFHGMSTVLTSRRRRGPAILQRQPW